MPKGAAGVAYWSAEILQRLDSNNPWTVLGFDASGVDPDTGRRYETAKIKKTYRELARRYCGEYVMLILSRSTSRRACSL